MKLNGIAIARKPPALTLVGTCGQGHISIQVLAQQPRQPDLERIIAVPVSGGAEFPEYIQERKTPYITPAKGEDEIFTAFDRVAGDQDQVIDHGAQPAAFDGVFCFRAAFASQGFLPNDP